MALGLLRPLPAALLTAPAVVSAALGLGWRRFLRRGRSRVAPPALGVAPPALRVAAAAAWAASAVAGCLPAAAARLAGAPASPAPRSCHQPLPKIIATFGSAGSTFTVTSSPALNGAEG